MRTQVGSIKNFNQKRADCASQIEVYALCTIEFVCSTMSSFSPVLSSLTFDVSGRVFIVTGGTQGLGLEIAKCLKECGARGISLVSRNAALGEVVRVQLHDEASCRVVFVQGDMGDEEAPARVVNESIDKFKDIGPINGLVNAAAVTMRGNLMTTTSSEFDRMMNINAKAPMLLTQALSKHMIEHNTKGSIVNICSVASSGGAPFIMAYCASKAALCCLTKNNGAELAPHGIRVNGINMGWCYTDNEDVLQTKNNNGDKGWIDKADANVPLGRIIRPRDVSAMAMFLLSDTSLMMTGQILDLHPEYADGMQSLIAVEGSADER